VEVKCIFVRVADYELTTLPTRLVYNTSTRESQRERAGDGVLCANEVRHHYNVLPLIPTVARRTSNMPKLPRLPRQPVIGMDRVL
jgi:hypothetical protein